MACSASFGGRYAGTANTMCVRGSKAHKEAATIEIILGIGCEPKPGRHFIALLHQVASFVDFGQKAAEGNIVGDFKFGASQLRRIFIDPQIAADWLRPKVMTVSTVIAGLLPIMWSTRVGAEVMKPLATPVSRRDGVIATARTGRHPSDLFLASRAAPGPATRGRCRRWRRLGCDGGQSWRRSQRSRSCRLQH